MNAGLQAERTTQGQMFVAYGFSGQEAGDILSFLNGENGFSAKGKATIGETIREAKEAGVPYEKIMGACLETAWRYGPQDEIGQDCRDLRRKLGLVLEKLGHSQPLPPALDTPSATARA